MKRPLSTSSFKIYLRRYFVFLLIFAVLYFLTCGIVYELSKKYNDRNDSQKVSMYQLQDLYGLESNSLDVLILGSSHAMCTYNPYQIEKHFGRSTFNLGTALQQPDTAYYLLKEVLKTQRPKYLIYDIYFKVMQNEKSAEQATTILKEMKPSFNRMDMFFHNLDKDTKVSYFSNWINPFGRLQSILSNMNQPPTQKKPSNYRGRGFFITSSVVKPDDLKEERHPFSKDYAPFHDRQVAYLSKLTHLAKENGIKVIFVSAPIPPTILNRIDHYSQFHKDASMLATQLAVPYYDFNEHLLNKNLVLKDTDFADQGHLNVDGNKKFNFYFLNFLEDSAIFKK